MSKKQIISTFHLTFFTVYYLSFALSDFIDLPVLPKVDRDSKLTSCTDTAEMMGGKIPGCQATSLHEGRNREKITKTLRYVFC